MPFKAIRLVILFDGAGGTLDRVVPRMKHLLEQHAFTVDLHRVADGPLDLTPYRGIVVGGPVSGLGLRRPGPTRALADAIERLPDLDGINVALFCVFALRAGATLDRMRDRVLAKGATVVATHAYPLWDPRREEDHLPAECMARIHR